MVNLESLKKTTDHPHRPILKPYSKPTIAKKLSCSTSHLRAVLNGSVKAGPELKAKLDQLVSEIKMQEGRA